jgi:poly-gamma-glutamate capsule biosynthesis protein CapA/YwtB (metallophosphatase superfamily)
MAPKQASPKGRLREARLVPLQARRFRLSRAAETDAAWLRDLLNRLGAPFGTPFRLLGDNTLILERR